jgi:DNA-binding XRE family transcriptional regulator
MSTLDLLPSIRDSETITCDHCHTRQFPRNGACVRCRRPLGLEYLVVPIENLLNCCGADCSEQLAHTIGIMLRSMRKRRHMCQSQLADKATCVNRSRISRAECGHVLLPLTQLLTLARALGLTSVILRFDSRRSGQGANPDRIR